MNLEQRDSLYHHIQKLDGLLAYAVAHNDAAEVDFCRVPLTFERVDPARYPAFTTVLDGAKESAAKCVAINAADEVAVDAFLKGHIALGRIHTILSQTSYGFDGAVRDTEDVLRIDCEARRLAKELL